MTIAHNRQPRTFLLLALTMCSVAAAAGFGIKAHATHAIVRPQTCVGAGHETPTGGCYANSSHTGSQCGADGTWEPGTGDCF